MAKFNYILIFTFMYNKIMNYFIEYIFDTIIRWIRKNNIQRKKVMSIIYHL